MAGVPILGQRQERQIALGYLCGVDAGYIRQIWGVSHTTVHRIIGEHSHEWNDSLVEFYRETNPRNKVRNAVHLYLGYNGRGYGLPNADLVNADFLNRIKNSSVYQAIENNIFGGWDVIEGNYEAIIRETDLERILESEPVESSGVDRLLHTIFGTLSMSGHDRAKRFVNQAVNNKLKESYLQGGNITINKIYDQVTHDIPVTLKRRLHMPQNPDVADYSTSREREVYEQEIKPVLETLSPREQEVLKMRFGLEGEPPKTFVEMGREFERSSETIRQVVVRALTKLRNFSRSERLIHLIKY